MTRIICALSLIVLTACGADGPPQAPSKGTTQPGLAISGTAKIGIGSQ